MKVTIKKIPFPSFDETWVLRSNKIWSYKLGDYYWEIGNYGETVYITAMLNVDEDSDYDTDIDIIFDGSVASVSENNARMKAEYTSAVKELQKKFEISALYRIAQYIEEEIDATV